MTGSILQTIMKSPFLMWLVLVAAWSQAAAENPALSPKAKECFEWYHTLGYPDLKDAVWAEVWTGACGNGANEATQAMTGRMFILKDEGTHFQALLPPMTSMHFTKAESGEPAARPPYARIGFEPRPFEKEMDQAVADFQKPAASPFQYEVIPPRASRRTQLFILAYACWRKGDISRAQQLYEAADAAPDYDQRHEKADLPGMRYDLERELGQMAMWRAILQAGGLDQYREGPLVPRPALLTAFQDIGTKFPNSRHVTRVAELAATLRTMIAEDESHVPLADEELAKLPVQKQVEEQIFRLRDQNGYQMGQPGACDIFESMNIGKNPKTTPAHKLVDLGHLAVPQLIAALADQRLTRSVQYGRDFRFSHYILTTGDCAAAILRRISGQSLHIARSGPDRTATPEDIAAATQIATAWWQEVQSKGERQALVDVIASGKASPDEPVRKLKKNYPDAVEAAVLAGAKVAENPSITRSYAELLSAIPSQAATDLLVKFLGADEELGLRIVAAKALWERRHPAAIPAMMDLWQVSTSAPAKADTASSADLLIQLLTVTGEPAAMDFLTKEWPHCNPRQKFTIVQSFATILPSGTSSRLRLSKPSPASPEARARAIALLVQALNDRVNYEGISGSYLSYTFVSPRICDMASWAIHRLEPGTYPFTAQADRKQRDRERHAAMNLWRSTQRLSALPDPEPNLPVLPAEKSLHISHITVSRDPQIAEAVAVKITQYLETLKGRSFSEKTLPAVVNHLISLKAEGLGGVVVDAIRNRDLTGVQLDITLEPGDLTNTRQLLFTGTLLVGSKGRSIQGNSIPLDEVGKTSAWSQFEADIQPVLTLPPDGDFVIHVYVRKEE